MKTVKKIIIPGIVIVLIVALVAWKLGKNKKIMDDKAAIAQQKTVIFPVTTVHADFQTLNQQIRVNGVFNPAHSLNFLAEQAGRVTSVSIREGQQISKGQLIAQTDDEQIQIDLTLANSTFEKAKADLNKYESMLAGNAATKQQIEEAKMALRSAEARVNTLKRQLKATRIVAPISGIVNKLSLEVGSYVSPGTSVAEIIDISTLKMKASLLDRDVVNFSVGQGIQVIPDLYPADDFKGKIVYISSKADASRNFSVDIEVANNSKKPLKAGMTGVVQFQTAEERKALMLPVQCIVGGLQNPQVFVIENNTSVKKNIQTGYMQGDFVEVLSGLKKEEAVVMTGQLNIADGSKVQIIK